LSLLLLISCAHTPAPIDPETIEGAEEILDQALREVVQVEACMHYFQEILDVQEKRDKNNETMSEFTSRYNAREIPIETHQKAFVFFIDEENKMYSEVTALYNTAYALECFE